MRRLTAVLLFVLAACARPHLPPTTVPPPPDPALAPFQQALQHYVDRTQPYRKQAAQQQASTAGQQNPPTTAATAALRRREQALADAIRTKVRPDAKQGEIFSPAVQGVFRQIVATLFKSPKHDLLMDELTEQNTDMEGKSTTAVVNAPVTAPLAPPLLVEALPRLPSQVEYHFLGRSLVLRDVDAGVVVDYLPDALPVEPPSHTAEVASRPPSATAPPTLAMPALRSGMVFAMMGDSGSGDAAQASVASAMLKYFTDARRFRFVLMLGDNLYHDDYTGEFLQPYKPLLDRGVTFYAALGNHDPDLEQHFKPFNMQDRDYYTFDEGNVRFAVLNSNHPSDPAQIKWLDTVFDGAGNKWRICFFHHPLYSSGEHATESREVIRPALEPALIRNHVNMVLTGHEHLYERVRPQHGIRFFVSGGGGRYLYHVHKSAFDEVADSEHHFMVGEIAGDAFLFEAVRPDGTLIDCGADFRTDAAARKHDAAIDGWLASCHQALAKTTR